MIPKNINLIWLGDTIPDYVFYSKTAYQKMNQDFNVQLIHYTNNQIEYFIQCDNITSTMSNIDIALWNSIHDFLNNPEDMLYPPNRYGNVKQCMEILETFKIYLITTIGGIYVDADTYPLKPFDNILQYDMIGLYHQDNHSDKCAIAFNKDFISISQLKKYKAQERWSKIYRKSNNTSRFIIFDHLKQTDNRFDLYSQLQKDFYACNINNNLIEQWKNLNNSSLEYFLHLHRFSWNYIDDKKCLVQSLSLDKIKNNK